METIERDPIIFWKEILENSYYVVTDGWVTTKHKDTQETLFFYGTYFQTLVVNYFTIWRVFMNRYGMSDDEIRTFLRKQFWKYHIAKVKKVKWEYAMAVNWIAPRIRIKQMKAK